MILQMCPHTATALHKSLRLFIGVLFFATLVHVFSNVQDAQWSAGMSVFGDAVDQATSVATAIAAARAVSVDASWDIQIAGVKTTWSLESHVTLQRFNGADVLVVRGNTTYERIGRATFPNCLDLNSRTLLLWAKLMGDETSLRTRAGAPELHLQFTLRTKANYLHQISFRQVDFSSLQPISIHPASLFPASLVGNLSCVSSISFFKKGDTSITLLLGRLQVLTQPTGMRAALIFDDGTADYASVVAPILERFGMVGTVPIVPYYTDGLDPLRRKNPEYMNLSTILQLQSRGHEFVNHGLSHMNFAQQPYSADTISKQISGSAAIMRNAGVQGWRHFVYPGGGESVDSYNFIKSSASVTTARLVACHSNTIQPTCGSNPYRLGALYAQVPLNPNAPKRKATLSGISSKLRALESAGHGFVLLTFHKVLKQGIPSQKVEDITENDFVDTILELNSLKIQVVTLSDLWDWRERVCSPHVSSAPLNIS